MTTHHPDFYNIPRTKDLLIRARTSETLKELNSSYIDGMVARIRLHNYTLLKWTVTIPFANQNDNPTYDRRYRLWSQMRREHRLGDINLWDTELHVWKRPL